MSDATADADVQTWTTYIVEDHHGLRALVHDPDRAERLSRSGLRVTAHTEVIDA